MPRERVSFPHRQAVSPKFGYDEAWLEDIPESSIESFAGTGNPFSLGEIKTGERVVDIGSGAGWYPNSDRTPQRKRGGMQITPMNVHGRWETPEEVDDCISWARAFFDAATPYAVGGAYMNSMTDDAATVQPPHIGLTWIDCLKLKVRIIPVTFSV